MNRETTSKEILVSLLFSLSDVMKNANSLEFFTWELVLPTTSCSRSASNSLLKFTASWNNHAISTEGMKTPLQLFYTVMDVSENSSSDESDSNADSDSDATIALHDPVPVPRCSFQRCQQLKQLMTTVDPLMQHSDQGKELYIEATNVAEQHLTTGCQVCAVCDNS